MSKDEGDPFWLRHPLIAAGLAVLAVVACGWGAYGIKVALSPVKGAGDVIIKQNDADTMIGAQEELQERYQGLEAACARITVAKQAADADPGNRVLATNYTATKAAYLTLVAEYNAATRKLTVKKMLGDLPEHVLASNCDGVN